MPDELLHRMDSLFGNPTKHVTETPDTLASYDSNVVQDLRHLLPNLPESAEYRLNLPQQPTGTERGNLGLQKILGKLVSKKVLLSDDFKRETFIRDLEIKEMAMVQLSAAKRAYIGSVAIGSELYRLPHDSAVYRLTETYWADWHGDTRLDVTVLSPNKEFFVADSGSRLSSQQRTLNNRERLGQLHNLDHLLQTFGF